jgi:hypothetical protein
MTHLRSFDGGSQATPQTAAHGSTGPWDLTKTIEHVSKLTLTRVPAANAPTEPPHRAKSARRGPRGARRKALVTADASAPGAGVPGAAPALGWPGAALFAATRVIAVCSVVHSYTVHSRQVVRRITSSAMK